MAYRMSAFRPIALIGGLIFLSSCAYIPGEDGFTSTLLSGLSRGKCSTEIDKHLQGVDWEKAKKLPLRIRQGDFRPTFMGLYMNTAYEMSIENADDTSHTFRAMEFFRAVAVAGVKDAKDDDFQEVSCLQGVTIPPLTTTKIRFVAVRDGSYEFDDNSLMISLAMVGSSGGFITIEPPRQIIESPLKHLDLFERNPVVARGDEGKAPGLFEDQQQQPPGLFDDQSNEPAPAPGLFDDQQTAPTPPTSLFDDGASQAEPNTGSLFDSTEQPISPSPSVPVDEVPSDQPPTSLFDAPSEDSAPPPGDPAQSLFDSPPGILPELPSSPLTQQPPEGLFDGPPETPQDLAPPKEETTALMTEPSKTEEPPMDTPSKDEPAPEDKTALATDLPLKPGDEEFALEEAPTVKEEPVIDTEAFVDILPTPGEETKGPAPAEETTSVDSSPVGPPADLSVNDPEGFSPIFGPPADIYSDPPDPVMKGPGAGGDAGDDLFQSG